MCKTRYAKYLNIPLVVIQGETRVWLKDSEQEIASSTYSEDKLMYEEIAKAVNSYYTVRF